MELIQQNNCLNNKELYAILDKFVNKDNFVEQDIVNEYNHLCVLHQNDDKQREEYNKINNYNNVFNNKGIYTINDLYKFMNDNFEYGGVLIVDNQRLKLPFGPVNGVAASNIMIRYQDEYVFKPIIDLYSKMNPDNETINYVREQYYNKDIDISSLKEYQQIIYQVGAYVQKNMWRQRTVEEILSDQISNCYESSFLVGEFFNHKNIKYQKYIIGRYDNMFLAHMFITYELEGKYYYFEHALRDFKGIYEYNSKEEMEQDIFVKFIYNDNYKMEKELNFDNYFLKPIDDLDPTGSFMKYFEYFDSIESIRFHQKNYDILMNLTDLVFKEVVNVGAIYNNELNVFYDPIEFPNKEDFYDIELWYKQVYKILRKNIVKIGFYPQDNLDAIYSLNSLGGFSKFGNIVKVEGVGARAQLLYSRKKVYNIFTIEDLTQALFNNDLTKTKDILMFSLMLENKKDLYEYGCYFTTNLSKDCVCLINNSNSNSIWDYNNIDLSGKLNAENFTLSNKNFLPQISRVAKALEVVSESIKLVTSKDYRNDFINSFVDYFIYMIDINSIDVDKLRNESTDYDSIFVDELVTKLLSAVLNKKTL